MPETDAFNVMLQAHKNGLAQVGVWHGELAEAYCDQLKTRGIVSEVFPID
jgi:ATP-dependent Clp protease adapter protein ClpS